MCTPLHRAGRSDPRVPVGHLNFRLLVKQCAAIFADGEHITHQKIIGLVANQIGFSHEDDNVSPMPEVKLSLGFVDVREMMLLPTPDSPVLLKQLMAGHERLLRPDEVRTLSEGQPPYFGGLLKPGDAEDPVFPE